MRPIPPATGAPALQVVDPAGDLPPLPAARYEDPALGPVLLTRWTFTPAERQRIAAGEDLYLVVATGDQPLQPLALQVGPGDYAVAP